MSILFKPNPRDYMKRAYAHMEALKMCTNCDQFKKMLPHTCHLIKVGKALHLFDMCYMIQHTVITEEARLQLVAPLPLYSDRIAISQEVSKCLIA